MNSSASFVKFLTNNENMATYKSAVRPFERFTPYVSFLYITAIAVDQLIAVDHPLQYENRMTLTKIRIIVTIIWFVAAAGSMPPYLGFLDVIKPQSCIVTLWPVFEAVIELLIYSINSAVFVSFFAIL